MADFLFVSQEMLDNWMTQGKIDFSGAEMTIVGDARRYVLEPAVRFVRVVGDEPDAAGLLAKVKTLDQLKSAGGEHYMDSVILGDVAYDVQNGFVARVNLGTGQKPPVEARAAGVETPVRVPGGAVRPQARPEPPDSPSRARTEPATPAAEPAAPAAAIEPSPAGARPPSQSELPTAPPQAAPAAPPPPQAAPAAPPPPQAAPAAPPPPQSAPAAPPPPQAASPAPPPRQAPAAAPPPQAPAPPLAPPATPPRVAASSIAAAAQKAFAGEEPEAGADDSDEQLLTKFLLDNLR